MKQHLAYWRSRSGKHFAALIRDQWGHSYTGNGCGGSLGNALSDADAIAKVQALVDSGYFQPDANKLPMIRTV